MRGRVFALAFFARAILRGEADCCRGARPLSLSCRPCFDFAVQIVALRVNGDEAGEIVQIELAQGLRFRGPPGDELAFLHVGCEKQAAMPPTAAKYTLPVSWHAFTTSAELFCPCRCTQRFPPS